MAADGMAVASSSKAPPPHRKPAASSSADPFANYSTAADLGFVDAAEEKRKAAELVKAAEKEAAAALEREERRKEGNIGQWEKVVRTRPPPPPPAALEGEEDDKAFARVERDEPLPNSATFLKERSLPDEDKYDPSAVTIKLKRQRLTLKEEEDIRRAAEIQAKIKREAEEAEQRRVLSEHRNATTQAGWQQVDVKDEALVQFDPDPLLTVKKEEDDADVKQEEGVEVKQEEEEVKPVVSMSGFKKRKMHGAAAARRKP